MIDFVTYIKDRIKGKAPKGARRSPYWRTVRKVHLYQHPECYVCGSDKKVNVHHIVPFHVAPDLELEPENLITLCEGGRFKSLNCHLVFGHLCNFQRINPNLVSDVNYWRPRFLN